jgi:predicted alpha/beta-hydrolase family hydrolase
VKPTELRFAVGEREAEVSALLLRPAHAHCLLVFAHGAGAGMRQAFMEAMAARLWKRGAATFRYQFPYMETGRGGPSPPALLTATVRSAVDKAGELAGDLPLLAGGKSMGGRMTSLAAAASPLPGVRGLIFFGFPLHAAGRPSVERGEHLRDVTLPMLFLQGTRDRLADLQLLRPLCDGLGRRATLHAVEGGDHSFCVLKRSERSDAEVLDELADAFQRWNAPLV